VVKISRFFLLAAVAVIASGCSHVATVDSVRATNIYSNYEGKIDGAVAYTVDSTSLTMLRKGDSIQGFLCSAHKFPVDAVAAFERSIPSMLDQIFKDVRNSESVGNGEIKLLFRIENYNPKVKFTPGFWSSNASATVELGVSVVAYVDGKRVLGTSADSQRTKDGDGGQACEGGAEVLGDATRAVIKDVLEKLGERISNNQALRTI